MPRGVFQPTVMPFSLRRFLCPIWEKRPKIGRNQAKQAKYLGSPMLWWQPPHNELKLFLM